MTEQNSLVGLGKVGVNVTVSGMTQSDWNNVSSATLRVQTPDGSIVSVPAQFDKILHTCSSVFMFDAEGCYRIGVRIDFVGGNWVTSSEITELTATDGFV